MNTRPSVHQRPEVPEEQGEEKCGDVMAIAVGVSQEHRRVW